ncbi:MAG: YggT family protein [Parachlamydiales bacterium]
MIILKIIDTLFLVYMVMLFIRILVSWVPEWRDTTFIRFISFYTDPYLNFFRRYIPPLGMFDLSPIVAFFCLQIIETIVKVLVALLIK